ncbi:MAG TPA: hypothetical protein VGL51_03960 [Solirubrobacteraceae bacterium]|jgi:hypothetical protein
MADDRRSSPTEDVQRLYEDAEKRTAQAFEEVVSRGSFGELLARMTENVVGLTKIGTDAFDLILRNLRLAGRSDVTRLARQLGRTEDKLELLLQEVERLQETLEEPGQTGRGSGRRSTPSSRGNRGSSSNGRQRSSGSTRGSRASK